jgi:hypothetical protein
LILKENLVKILEDHKLCETHVVNKILIGASIDASITVTYNKQDGYKKISIIYQNKYSLFFCALINLFYLRGNLFGDMNFGPVSASTKANLESIVERHKTETETKISIQSQPNAFLNILFQLFKF